MLDNSDGEKYEADEESSKCKLKISYSFLDNIKLTECSILFNNLMDTMIVIFVCLCCDDICYYFITQLLPS